MTQDDETIDGFALSDNRSTVEYYFTDEGIHPT